jgi:hypothetical protein
MTVPNLEFTNVPVLDNEKVEAYGCEMAPLVNYHNYSKKIASEFVLKYAGKKRRVYSWLNVFGKDRMYVFVNGVETFVTPEIETMLHYGQPSYDYLTPVAQSVKVAA